MVSKLNLARRAIRHVVRSSGYGFWEGGVYPTSTMTASLHSHGDNKYVLTCGCDHLLSTEERNRLWHVNGEVLMNNLREAGFDPNPRPYGPNQRRIFVLTI